MARRKTNTKKLKKQIFIIGEGITEQIYFSQLKNEEHLNVKINPQLPQHTDIDNIVKKAKYFAKASYINLIFCIIDLDRIYSDKKETEKYLKYKSKYKNSEQIFFFEVNPCFELWYLLHFEYSAREYSGCYKTEKKLIKFITDYEKTEKYLTNKNMYVFLKDKMKDALMHSNKLNSAKATTKCDIYKIIEKLKINYKK